MTRYNILNLAAGQGLAGKEKTPQGIDYYTKCIGDARLYVKDRCLAHADDLCFCVYGGDGTINEVVSGILDANAADRASVGVVPYGTGNDFARILQHMQQGDSLWSDVIHWNDAYAVNMLNIGFDCSVVEKTAHMKTLPLISGSFAYILGVADVLFHKISRSLYIRYTDANGQQGSYDGQVLLCAVANAPYCGGGFCAAPVAQYDDGLLDLMIIRKVSRARFLSLVSAYRSGAHVNSDGDVTRRFADIISYHRCKSIRIEGMEHVCADGEIFPCTAADIGVFPHAIRFLRVHA